MIELGGLGSKTGCDTPQTLAAGDLAACQGSELLRARELADASVPVVALHDPGERRPWEKVHELGEKRLAAIHP